MQWPWTHRCTLSMQRNRSIRQHSIHLADYIVPNLWIVFGSWAVLVVHRERSTDHLAVSSSFILIWKGKHTYLHFRDISWFIINWLMARKCIICWVNQIYINNSILVHSLLLTECCYFLSKHAVIRIMQHNLTNWDENMLPKNRSIQPYIKSRCNSWNGKNCLTNKCSVVNWCAHSFPLKSL